ncbi:BnaC02g24470D [Brassica napus]|uniref:BnaC02g24470D protein n=1 Tax=Brassica napus TaxID=3708 RepID=A0A078G4R4_BRANA|nr:BnaC02g24470D [Brassica napus]
MRNWLEKLCNLLAKKDFL